MDLCVPWLEESPPWFERSTNRFCSIINAWNKKSATFIEHNVFALCPILWQKDIGIVIMKLQLLHGANKIIIGGQKQRNKIMPPIIQHILQPLDVNDGCKWWSSWTIEKYWSTSHSAAALDGCKKQPLAYHALRDNHLWCVLVIWETIFYKNAAWSPIFKQQNITPTNNLDKHAFSLSKMRSEIHKLKPEELEETVIEKSITHSGANGPKETPIRDWRGVSTFIRMNKTYKIYLGISQTNLTKCFFEYLIKKCSCVISQMNNGIPCKQYWLTIGMDLQMISGKQFFTYSLKIGWMMNNLEFLWICFTLQHRNWYYCMQVEEQEKPLSHVQSLKS